LNYEQAIKYLYDLRRFGLKFGLENTRRLAAQAGDPQNRLRFIHVAGTNGKGSTCAFLESVYRAAGLKVGLFTSPHLISFRERIQINRELISETDVARLVAEFGGDAYFTFFEAVTIMALKYFAARQCDLVIWETGLGGRLDATNIVTPLACAITNVQLDHEEWLGRTIPEIAFEKAGIIKPGVPIVTAADEPALRVIRETAAERGAPLTVVGPLESYELGLAGAHQHLNAAVALAAIRAVAPQLPVPESALRRGFKDALWAGRLQTITRPNGQRILIDGAHNPDGARALADSLSTQSDAARPALILGAMADKDWLGICQILAPLASKLLFCPVSSGRSADPHHMAESCRRAQHAAPVFVCESLADAMERVVADPFVVVTGSLHFIGEAMERLGLAGAASERELNEYVTPRPKISAITLDIGGTLIEPWPSVGHLYAAVAARHGLDIPPETLNRQFAAAWKSKKNFGHSLSDWSQLVDATFAGLADPPPSRSFFPELYDCFVSPQAWRIFDDVLPTLAALRRRGLKIAALSNWDERLHPLLRALDLDRYFDTIIVSAEVGRPKPAPEMFRAAAESLGADPASILHVGDGQAEDFEGAKSAGFRALLLRRGEAPRDPGVIAGLDKILELI
jgi:dihydrofolate synthase/folylpolyglutamate synthase